MRLRTLFAAASLSALAACGGGGGGSSTPPPPPPTYANTSSPFYMPVHAGNTWTFTTGSKMADAGPGTIVCSCTLNGTPYERVDLFDPTGAYGSSFLFTKYNDAGNGGVLTTALVGTSTDRGNTISPFSARMPVMNDAPVQGYTYNLNGGTSTITAAGQVQTLANGQQIRSVADDTVSAPPVQNVSFGFAQGVGVTMVGVGSSTTQISSFSIDAANSTAVVRAPQTVQHPVVTQPVEPSSIVPLLSKLF